MRFDAQLGKPGYVYILLYYQHRSPADRVYPNPEDDDAIPEFTNRLTYPEENSFNQLFLPVLEEEQDGAEMLLFLVFDGPVSPKEIIAFRKLPFTPAEAIRRKANRQVVTIGGRKDRVLRSVGTAPIPRSDYLGEEFHGVLKKMR